VVSRRSAVGDKTRVLGATTHDEAISVAEKALGIT
jgi:hypothetical protein